MRSTPASRADSNTSKRPRAFTRNNVSKSYSPITPAKCTTARTSRIMASMAERSPISVTIASSLLVRPCMGRTSVSRRQRQFARSPSRSAVPMAPAAPVISTRSVFGSIMNVLPCENCSRPRLDGTGSASVPDSRPSLCADLENHTESLVATHHPIISGLGFLERENLVHRGDRVKLTEQQRIFRIGRGARIPALHRSTFAKQTQRIDSQIADRADDHHDSVDTEAARDCLHRAGAGHGCYDGLGAAHGQQRLGRIARFAIDIIVRTQGPRQGFLVAAPVYRHGPEALPGSELNAQVAKT